MLLRTIVACACHAVRAEHTMSSPRHHNDNFIYNLTAPVAQPPLAASVNCLLPTINFSSQRHVAPWARRSPRIPSALCTTQIRLTASLSYLCVLPSRAVVSPCLRRASGKKWARRRCTRRAAPCRGLAMPSSLSASSSMRWAGGIPSQGERLRRKPGSLCETCTSHNTI